MADANIYVIIDGSGSMHDVRHDVVKGINEFIKEQQDDAQSQGDDVKFWLTTFDTTINDVYSAEDLELVKPLSINDTYLGGGTALLDAIGKTLTNAEDEAALRNIVVIYTDGQERDSREFTRDQIGDLLKKLTDTGDWQVVYLGAEFGDFAKDRAQYAMATSTATGTYSAMNTSKMNSPLVLSNVSKTVTHYRNANEEQLANIKAQGVVAAATADAAVDWDAVKDEPKTKVKEPKGK